MEISYRLLRPEEFEKVESVFRDQMGIPPPRADKDLILVGEANDKIVIVAALQMVPMLGLYIDPEHRGTDEYKRVSEHIDVLTQYNKLPGYTLATNHAGAKRMARLAGMRETDLTFYVKTFGGG